MGNQNKDLLNKSSEIKEIKKEIKKNDKIINKQNNNKTILETNTITPKESNQNIGSDKNNVTEQGEKSDQTNEQIDEQNDKQKVPLLERIKNLIDEETQPKTKFV